VSRTITKCHPLESIVLEAFGKRGHHDGASLGYYFAGSLIPGKARAYSTVARDVLGEMERQGKLVRDAHGWWRLAAAETKGSGG
jgi:hypothetical protein